MPISACLISNQKGFTPLAVLVGILVLSLMAGGVYYLGTDSKPKPSPTPIISQTQKPEVCIQIIAPAKNPKTGECKEFPTPCDVPEGWEKVGSCIVKETTNWEIYTNIKYGYSIKYPPGLEWQLRMVNPSTLKKNEHIFLAKRPTKEEQLGHFFTDISLESITENQKNQSLKDWVTYNIIEPTKKIYRDKYKDEVSDPQRKTLFKNGKQIEAVSGARSPGAYDTLQAYIMENNKIIEFFLEPGYIESDKYTEENQDIFYETISTFKFLDQE